MTDEQAKAILPVVKSIAGAVCRRLPPRSVDVDDLISAGMMGALVASRKYDAAAGVPFESYAKFRIRGAILDYLRSLDPVGRHRRRKIKAGEKIAVPIVVSIESESVPENSVIDRSAAASFLRSADQKYLMKLLRRAHLPRRYRRVLKSYFGKDRTMADLARTYRVQESRISQMINASLRKLASAARELSMRQPRSCERPGCGRELPRNRKRFCSKACKIAGADRCIETGCSRPVYKQVIREGDKVRYRGRRCRFHFRAHRAQLQVKRRAAKPDAWKQARSREAMEAYRRRRPKLTPDQLHEARGRYVRERTAEEGRAVLLKAWETRRRRAGR